MVDTGSAGPSRYVPPHLRNSAPKATTSSSSRLDPRSSAANSWSSSPSPSAYPQPGRSSARYNDHQNPSLGGASRTPWAVESSQSAPRRPRRPISPNPPEAHGDFKSGRGWGNDTRGTGTTHGHGRRGSYNPPSSTSPSLHVFGDSFVGPFKLLSDDCARFQTFKGASAKGLNNPNSLKQVSKELVPLLNNLLAPPPYAYFPSTGRWALLIFGNVDLQINYLWQLQHKPISQLSFPHDGSKTDTVDDDESEAAGSAVHSRHVLANATDTSMKGAALGPQLFVKAVTKAYTAWLEREIVNGPIGQAIRDRKEKASSSVRKLGQSKVLIAAALPPLVEDEVLPRIPEKYVERLEEDHAKAHRAMDSASKAPASGKTSRTPWNKALESTEDEITDGLSTLKVTDEGGRGRLLSPNSQTGTATPRSASTSSSSPSRNSSTFEAMDSSVHTNITVPSSPSSSEDRDNKKKSIESLLLHDPPLCTLPVRIRMTNDYNIIMKRFCESHSDVFDFIDISSAMLTGNYTASDIGAADRSTWACPVDATNIHPLWEPTLPLWLEELKKAGLPTDAYSITADAEETFRAYEADKRERTARQPWGKDGKQDRVKLRDE